MKRLIEIDDATHAAVPKRPTSEILAAASVAVWPTASAEDFALARQAAKIALMQLDAMPGVTLDMLAATIATMAPAYRAMIAAAPAVPDAPAVTDESVAAFLAEPFELNYSNYNSDDVEQLQNWALRAYDIIKARAALSAAAGDDARDAAESPRFTLSGHELLAALDFIAPDRDTLEHVDQLDGDVTIQYGNGHSGKGYYAWCTDYADEGAVFLGDAVEETPTAEIAAARTGGDHE